MKPAGWVPLESIEAVYLQALRVAGITFRIAGEMQWKSNPRMKASDHGNAIVHTRSSLVRGVRARTRLRERRRSCQSRT